MNKYFIKVERVSEYGDARGIVSCTQDRQYADSKYGIGKYYAVYCADEHGIAREALKQGFIDDWSKIPAQKQNPSYEQLKFVQAADDNYQRELVRVYGENNAGDARYQLKHDDAAVQKAADEFRNLSEEWHKSVTEARTATVIPTVDQEDEDDDSFAPH
ncbi:hypothetical protein RP726_05765 [Candidatus Methylospira mobilis]|uniref:hypothetical protein n=1 Tax=Candidatus Methylospira mobilis TaxID=1808979 RepID=UPI0028EEE9B2|nr:hypothetical protein [Candidatus Methylospira mobilis]WNV05919.1 hypothetical protein RP726_05765 [Candidatus Methylospira mobilis]